MTLDANGWMPIETSKGKRGAHKRLLIAQQRLGGDWIVREAHYVARKRAWFEAGDYGDDEFSQPYHPTHWQPLPKPPVQP